LPLELTKRVVLSHERAVVRRVATVRSEYEDGEIETSVGVKVPTRSIDPCVLGRHRQVATKLTVSIEVQPAILRLLAFKPTLPAYAVRTVIVTNVALAIGETVITNSSSPRSGSVIIVRTPGK
jgi:hypothetical protein